jgi:hypothetical protein
MSERYYFLLTALPALPELGEVPPLGLGAFRALVEPSPSALAPVEAVLLEQDLLGRESVLAGETPLSEPVVLTTAQVAGEEPLPEFLTAAPERAPKIPADATWASYWRHVHAVGVRRSCEFLRRWAGFEVGLRNALALARAAALNLEPQEYLVAEDLADPDAPVGEVVSAWSAAADPLSALRVLDERRWQWVEDCARYYSFALDELTAYARRLVLVHRWHVLVGAGSPSEELPIA